MFGQRPIPPTNQRTNERRPDGIHVFIFAIVHLPDGLIRASKGFDCADVVVRVPLLVFEFLAAI